MTIYKPKEGEAKLQFQSAKTETKPFMVYIWSYSSILYPPQTSEIALVAEVHYFSPPRSASYTLRTRSSCFARTI